MAEDSWPSPDHSDGAVNDHEYEQLTGRNSVSGLIGDPTTALPLVYADSTGRHVKIRADRYAKVRGRTWWSGASELTQSLAANSSGQPRIDRVVLRYSRTTHNVRLAVLQGTPAAVPAAPALTNVVSFSGVWELPLARVAVPNAAVTTAAVDVTPEAWYLSDDGAVLCTSTTRPPIGLVGPGVKLHETDTGKGYASVGSAWQLMYETAGRVNLTAAAGWTVHANGAWVRRRHGLVTLQAQLTRSAGSFTSGASLLTTLPAGFRPVDSMLVTVYLQGSYIGQAGVSATTGTITLVSYAQGTGTGEYVLVPTVTFQAA